MYLSQFANQLPGCWKLSWHRRWLCFHHNNLVTIRVQSEALWQRVYLPVLHHCSEFTCSLASGGPLLLRKQSESQSCGEGPYHRLLLPDRLARSVLWQMIMFTSISNYMTWISYQLHLFYKYKTANVKVWFCLFVVWGRFFTGFMPPTRSESH